MVIVDARPGKPIPIGRLGENEARVVRFLVRDILYHNPEAQFTLLHQRSSDPDAYPVNPGDLSVLDNHVLWLVRDYNLTAIGIGKAELIARENDAVIKTVIYETQTEPALDGSGEPPEPWESWVAQVAEDAARATAAAELLESPTAEATTLEPEEQATAEYDNGVFRFGIPRGAGAESAIAEIRMNGSAVQTVDNVADLGTVITQHQDISGKLDVAQKGANNGVAELDNAGKVPASQLPSYVDDVVDGYYHEGRFYADDQYHTDIPGESGKVYIDVSTNITYRWSGSVFAPIGSDLALGETSSTAYRGDRGKAAYDAAVVNPDSTPTENSTDLITSGGVYTALGGKAPKDNPVFTGSISMGRKSGATVATGSIAIGNNVTASGSYSQAMGNTVSATATSSHAEGQNTSASGNYSHAEGYSSTSGSTLYGAKGKADHIEGYNTFANSGSSSNYYGAHAEGNATKATNNAAHAEGYSTTASGLYSHAEGYSAQATGYNSHAEGYSTTASGQCSHAEGNSAQATGQYSHAEGYSTTASGQYSHAEGSYTQATGIYSHAEGYYTVAKNIQHVFGRYNVEDQNITIVFPDLENADSFDPTKSLYLEGSIVKIDNTLYVAHSNAPTRHSSPKYDTYNWYVYTSPPPGTNAPEWTDTLYAQNTIVKVTDANGTITYYGNRNAITDLVIYPNTSMGGIYWHSQPTGSTYNRSNANYAEIIGNGTNLTRGNNIRALDWGGNERLRGDLYVGCNDDSSGGTKVVPLPAVTASDNGKILMVVNGAWAAETIQSAQGVSF